MGGRRLDDQNSLAEVSITNPNYPPSPGLAYLVNLVNPVNVVRRPFACLSDETL
jgi:hypothetical protein